MYYELLRIVLDTFQFSDFQPSPLKESILRLTSKLLIGIHEARNQRSVHVTPQIMRQLSDEQNLNLINCLSTLGKCQHELETLYLLEKKCPVYSSYLQQLVDLMVVSDILRPDGQKLCTEFHFKIAGIDETPSAPIIEVPAIWSCSICTFENPDSEIGCAMCGTPKPKVAPAAAVSDSNTVSSTDMFMQMMAVVSTMKYFVGHCTLEQSNAVQALLQTAWKVNIQHSNSHEQTCHIT
jgi:hypothetical protein